VFGEMEGKTKMRKTKKRMARRCKGMVSRENTHSEKEGTRQRHIEKNSLMGTSHQWVMNP